MVPPREPVAPAMPPPVAQPMAPPTGPPVAAAAAAAVPGVLSADERQMAMFAHLGQLLGAVSGIGGFLVPLIILLTKGKESDFVRRAAIESLNFWITGFVATFVAALTLLLLVGFVLLPLVLLAWFVMPIVAGIKVNDGTDYRYPVAIRILS